MAEVNTILDKLDALPAMSSSGNRIIALLNEGDVDLDEVERVVRTDEAISAAVLRLGNSATYGRPGRVFSLREALQRIGSKSILKLVMQESVGGCLTDAGTAYGVRRGAMRRGALAGALIAEEIARSTGFKEPELCFISALLRDIGKLAIDMFAEQGHLADLSDAGHEDESFLETERRVIGADHGAIGAELARRWDLPDRIGFAIGHHHDPPGPDEDTHDELADIVHAADVICLWSGLATGADGLRYPLADHVRTGILRRRQQAESYISEMWTQLKELESEIGLDSPKEKSA